MELSVFKLLLGITTSDKDTPLQFILDDVTETVLNYCNITELPAGLKNTAYRMAIDLYRNENIGSEDPASQVTSISEGDTSTSFGQHVDDAFLSTVLKNYIPQLNRYRKVGF